MPEESPPPGFKIAPGHLSSYPLTPSELEAERKWNAQLASLEEWAVLNRKDARNDTLFFWVLKIPAILASASAGIWAHFHLTTVSLISGAVASVCVLIDGIHPRGTLRNVHLRAFHDIRKLVTNMVIDFDSSDGGTEQIINRILADSRRERNCIATYIRDAYKDAQGNAQSVVFEIGKDAIRPLLSSLETRTGKAVVDQPDPTKTNKQIKK